MRVTFQGTYIESDNSDSIPEMLKRAFNSLSVCFELTTDNCRLPYASGTANTICPDGRSLPVCGSMETARLRYISSGWLNVTGT